MCEMERLYQQRQESPESCDVTLLIEGTMIKVHRCILEISPYFRSLFKSGMEETLTGVVNLKFGTTEAVRGAVQFLYKGALPLNLSNVGDFLDIADYFAISEMVDACRQFVLDTPLTVENCVQVMHLSSEFDLDSFDAAYHFVVGHLYVLMAGPHLLHFKKSSVVALFRNPTLCYVRREDFFDFVVRWVEDRQEERSVDFEDLFSALYDNPPIPANHCERVEYHPYVLQSETCKALYMETKQKALDRRASVGDRGMSDVIVAGGGRLVKSFHLHIENPQHCSRSLCLYVVAEDRWVKLPLLPYPMQTPLMAVSGDGSLLVLDALDLRHLMTYSPSRNAWSSVRLKVPRGGNFRVHAFLSCGDGLFLVADGTADVWPQACQYVTNDDWAMFRRYAALLSLNRETGEMSLKRHLFQCCDQSKIAVACQQSSSADGTADGNVIFITGYKVSDLDARRPTGRHQGNQLLVYDAGADMATKLAHPGILSCPPAAFGLRNGLLLAHGTQGHLRSFYDPALGRFVDAAAAASTFKLLFGRELGARSHFATVALNDEVYVVGGREEEEEEGGGGEHCGGGGGGGGVGGARAVRKVVKCSLAAGRWTEVASLPADLCDPVAVRGRMATERFRCHAECPHCDFLSPEERPAYDVEYGMPQFLKRYANDGEDDDYLWDSNAWDS